jgi:regulator of PEP synthase PpsR (kinase-PPPase family)
MKRTVYFISESTGITAKAMGHSLLSQFEGAVEFQIVYMPYINSVHKARELVLRFDEQNVRPIVIATMMEPEVAEVLRGSRCLYLELFDTYLPALTAELGIGPSGAKGRSHGISDDQNYKDRMSIINFAMVNDDGVRVDKFGEADVVLVGVSRSGKTPTCLYMAMHFGLRAANYPLTEEDFAQGGVPEVLLAHGDKLFGLTIEPERLHQIREERRPGSPYASLANCHAEVRQALQIFKELDIQVLDTTTQSIEEISSRITKTLMKRAAT